jgi:hypothetical protein
MARRKPRVVWVKYNCIIDHDGTRVYGVITYAVSFARPGAYTYATALRERQIGMFYIPSKYAHHLRNDCERRRPGLYDDSRSKVFTHHVPVTRTEINWRHP